MDEELLEIIGEQSLNIPKIRSLLNRGADPFVEFSHDSVYDHSNPTNAFLEFIEVHFDDSEYQTILNLFLSLDSLTQHELDKTLLIPLRSEFFRDDEKTRRFYEEMLALEANPDTADFLGAFIDREAPEVVYTSVWSDREIPLEVLSDELLKDFIVFTVSKPIYDKEVLRAFYLLSNEGREDLEINYLDDDSKDYLYGLVSSSQGR